MTRLDWLDSRHTFSFGRYHDGGWLGFRTLRVINDDRVAPGGGFDTHAHRDMEILTWVVEGAVAHRDSMGHEQVVTAGELQRMTAGTGVTHSEWNASAEEPVRFLQVWILPARSGLEPSYQQRAFRREDRLGRWQLLASPSGDGGLSVHQDARVSAAVLRPGEALRHRLSRGRGAWLHVVTGCVRSGGELLDEGAGVGLEEESELEVAGHDAESEVLLFDLA